jgi:hypothetical protein
MRLVLGRALYLLILVYSRTTYYLITNYILFMSTPCLTYASPLIEGGGGGCLALDSTDPREYVAAVLLGVHLKVT